MEQPIPQHSVQSYDIQYLEERSQEGDRKLFIKGTQDEIAEADTYNEYALTSIQVFDEDGKFVTKRIRIDSAYLCNVIEKAAGRWFGSYQLGHSRPFEIDSPFAILFHYMEDLGNEQPEGEEHKRHLKLLFHCLLNETGQKAASLITNGLITFDLLWAIFKPGDYVYTSENGQGQILFLENAMKTKSRYDGPYFKLDCSYTASDGRTMGRAKKVLRIEESEFLGKGPSRINNLSAIPLSHLVEDVKPAMTRRATKYVKLHDASPILYYYQGLCELHKNDGTKEWATIAGRIQVDAEAFFEEEPSNDIKIRPWKDDNGNPSADSMPDDTKVLCPSYVYGYCLSMRKWGRFFLPFLQEVKWNTEAWKNLILPPRQKKVLRSMIDHHTFPTKSEARDEDYLKGKGLVIMLHGPPGTGKTLTAVAGAEMRQKPLLLYPAGELGSSLEAIQASIQTILRITTRWKAILLIDEADVFLESRESGGQTNLERNALVAVFLRQLEYSQGVIFLTSNRADTFDTAMKSRIHMTLHYPAPGFDTRRNIWECHLNQLSDERRGLEVTRTSRFAAKFALNGREISNILNSALTLAKSEGDTKLTQKHLGDVLAVWEASSPGRMREFGRMAPRVVFNFVFPVLGVFVLVGLAVIICFHGYQVIWNGSRDILIVYR